MEEDKMSRVERDVAELANTLSSYSENTKKVLTAFAFVIAIGSLIVRSEGADSVEIWLVNSPNLPHAQAFEVESSRLLTHIHDVIRSCDVRDNKNLSLMPQVSTHIGSVERRPVKGVSMDTFRGKQGFAFPHGEYPFHKRKRWKAVDLHENAPEKISEQSI